MISRTLTVVLLTLTLMSTGCAGGFRAAGPRASVGAGVTAVPPEPTPYAP